MVQVRVWGSLEDLEKHPAMCLYEISPLSKEKDAYIPDVAYVGELASMCGTFQLIKASVPRAISRFEIKEQAVVSLKPLSLFPFPSSLSYFLLAF